MSPACTNCYAATLDHRLGGDHWDLKGPRKFFGDKHWNEPLKWDREAKVAGVRKRVFCASMADVFEDRDDLIEQRMRLWKLIVLTPNLDWLLLTKRPENIARMTPWTRGITREVAYGSATWHDAIRSAGPASPQWSNVWLGTTVENQEYAEERLPHLLAVPAVVHFVSAEPLLGPVYLNVLREDELGAHWNAFDAGLDWVITGSESGVGRREQDVEWYRALQRQCSANGAAFFLKQAREVDPQRCDVCRKKISVYAHSPTHSSYSCDCTMEGGESGATPPIAKGDGSWTKKDGTIEQPYLDGVQHINFPRSNP